MAHFQIIWNLDSLINQFVQEAEFKGTHPNAGPNESRHRENRRFPVFRVPRWSCHETASASRSVGATFASMASFQCWRRAARPWLCLRSVKCGNATTEVIWVDPVAETGLRTGAFVAKCGDRSSEDKCPGDRSRTCRIGLQRRSMYTLQVWPQPCRSLSR